MKAEENIHQLEIPVQTRAPLTINIPKPIRSEVSFGDTDLLYRTTGSKPNLWHRFWYKILLDWRWKDAS